MTALKKYLRLECTGLWRPSPDAQRREVLVSFGDATLILADIKSERALGHWSLPAIIRLNPGETPALYAPGEDAGEELEIEDETMIDALEQVGALIRARAPRPGRLRLILLGLVAAVIAAAAILWLPDALIRHTASALPLSKRQEIGRMALADLTRLTGAPCAMPEGQAALARLRDRLLGRRGEIVVLRDGLRAPAHLPGGLILLPRALVETADSPDVVAGAILVEDERREASQPLAPLLRHAGIMATLKLLTSGELPPSALRGYGEVMLSRARQGSAFAPAREDDLIARFAEAELPLTPYARHLDPSGETVLKLIESDPMRGIVTDPALGDTDWVALQGICMD